MRQRGSLRSYLLVTLIAKLSYEEQLLQTHFAEYAAYQQRSWRLVPFVF